MQIIAKLPNLGKAFERFKSQNLPEKPGQPVAGANRETGGNGAVLPEKQQNSVTALNPAQNTQK